LFCITTSQAQTLKNIVKKVTTKDTSKAKASNLTTNEIVTGLKEALVNGANTSTTKLSAVDGFFKNAALKILLPEEAQKVQQTVSKLPGGSKMIDDAILSMNRAAEDASKSAAPIFISAIKNINFADAMGILKGGDSAATKYLRQQTTAQLITTFKPIIEESLAKVNATQYWNTIFSNYNKFVLKKINPDLAGYVTDKALAGIFYQLALEEQKIRKDPVAQTTDILKKVFGSL